MSQAFKRVQWCINKAKKELEESGIHRGLVKRELDAVLAERHISKAEHNLRAALYFDQGEYSDWSASAFFYCLYHCFLAILWKHGYESRNQECTLAAIDMLREEGKINIESRFVDALKITKTAEVDHSVIKLREDFQYGVEVKFHGKKEFESLRTMCKEMIDKTREIVHRR